MNHTIPIAVIHPSRIILYNEKIIDPSIRRSYCTEKPQIEKLLSSKRKASGMLSVNAQRKLSKALDYMLHLSKERKVFNRLTQKTNTFKIAFITLTLSSEQIHSDNEIRRLLLNQLLTEIRVKYNVQNYIWKAEKQENGNIHFHILVDKYIPWYDLRNMWNRIQNKLGYVDRYRTKMKELHKNGFYLNKSLLKRWSAKSQYEAYKKNKITDYSNPNSIDIHSLYRIKNIKKYLLKYISKNVDISQIDDPRKIEKLLVKGRLWGCNQELASARGARLVISNEIADELSTIVKLKKNAVYAADYFTLISVTIKDLIQCNATKILSSFYEYIDKNFASYRPEYQHRISTA